MKYLVYMTRDTDILNQLETKLLDCVAKAQEVFKKDNLPIPPIKFRRMGKTAGQATWNYEHDGFRYADRPILDSLIITINQDYCQNGHWEDVLNNTLPHEYAHILAIYLYGRRLGSGHGHGWKNCMRALGLKPERCHSMSLEGVKVRKTFQVEYSCGCDKHYVGKLRHNKLQNNPRYSCSCRKCRQKIVFTGKSGVGLDKG